MAKTTLMALIVGAALWLVSMATPVAAWAQACCSPPSPPPSCNCTPPPCCTPPTPPPQSPPCCSPANNIVVPGVNVFVAPSVVVNVQTRASATAFAGAQAQTNTFVNGGGGGFVQAPGAVGIVNLNVEGERRRTAYEATRTRFQKVVIRAFCFDDREVPHPASQVGPETDIDDAYDGELYRCIAGSHMQVSIAHWSEHISFDGGDTMSCAKGEALYHVAGGAAGAAAGAGGGHGGRLECRPQRPARDCNERSLLRRFGAGMKVLWIVITERYTAYREESVQGSTASAMSLDGGVGGVIY